MLILLAAIIGFVMSPVDSYAKKNKVPKIYKKFESQAEKMTKKGGFAFVGIAVSDAGRLDLGRTKAHQDALQKMTQAKRSYVESTVHDFREEIGVGKDNEVNDVFRSLTDVIAADFLKGARIVDFEMHQTKANKKEGTATYLVLLVITPKYTYQSISNEMDNVKGSEASLYQRYVDSEAQKIHDQKIKEFKEEFKISD